GHAKREVVVPGPKGARSVRDGDRVANGIAKPTRNVRAEDDIEQVIESRACGKLQGLAAAVLQVLEIVWSGPDDAKAAVTVAKGKRDRPGYLRAGNDVLITAPRDVVGGVAYAEHRIEKELHSA